MRVVVFRPTGRQVYDGITAIGVGHLRQDLVLVAGDNAPQEVGDWTSLTIERVPVQSQPDDNAGDEDARKRTRMITFDD